MAKIDGSSSDAFGLILTGMFWLMPILVSQRIPAPLDPPLTWIELGLSTIGIVAGVVQASRD